MRTHFQRNPVCSLCLFTFAILLFLSACVVTQGEERYPQEGPRHRRNDLDRIQGLWLITANGVPGRLEFFRERNTWNGRISFDAHQRWEELTDIFFDSQSGQLQFFRPRFNQPFTGTLSGNEISGTFTETGNPFPWFARREASEITGRGDVRRVQGAWLITANDVHGRLELFWERNNWSGRISFDAYQRWEELTDVFFDPQSGQLQFFRPRFNQPFTGTLSGNEISGTFTEAGRNFPWFARRP
jgi:hypothetical protein